MLLSKGGGTVIKLFSVSANNTAGLHVGGKEEKMLLAYLIGSHL